MLKKLYFSILICILVLIIYDISYAIKIEYVTDGDTYVTDNGTKLRIYGVDTPETNQLLGKEIKKEVSDLIMNKEIKLDIKDTDRYGRLIVKIYVVTYKDDLANILVSRGYAFVYDKYCKEEPYCNELRKQRDLAEHFKYGIWSIPKDRLEYPWEYRKHK